jgi:hypothetical protein
MYSKYDSKVLTLKIGVTVWRAKAKAAKKP